MAASNNNTVVISFSIALFLLLILLLLITYNSSCQMDNVETFLGDPVQAAARDRATIDAVSSVGRKAQEDPAFSVDTQMTGQFFDGNILPSDPTGNAYNDIIDPPTEDVIEADPAQHQISSASESITGACFPRDRLTSDDLLPQGANSKWAKVNPAGAGNIFDQNFLNAGHHIGVNTVGQSLRNANRQLRHEPPNPQVPVSPWQISTIEPDNRMNGLFDIGSSPTFAE